MVQPVYACFYLREIDRKDMPQLLLVMQPQLTQDPGLLVGNGLFGGVEGYRHSQHVLKHRQLRRRKPLQQGRTDQVRLGDDSPGGFPNGRYQQGKLTFQYLGRGKCLHAGLDHGGRVIKRGQKDHLGPGLQTDAPGDRYPFHGICR